MSIARNGSQIEIGALTEGDVEAALGLWSTTQGIALTRSDSPEAIRRFLRHNKEYSAAARTSDQALMARYCAGIMAVPVFSIIL